MPLDTLSRAVSPETLAGFTRPGLIVPRLAERDTAGIIGELSQRLQREGCVADVLPFYHTALNQELLATSVLDCGIAFPHGRLSGVRDLRFAFGRLPEAITWGTGNTWPVQFVFLLAVPASDAATYLHLLACIARLGQQAPQLKALRESETVDEILTVLSKIRMR